MINGRLSHPRGGRGGQRRPTVDPPEEFSCCLMTLPPPWESINPEINTHIWGGGGGVTLNQWLGRGVHMLVNSPVDTGSEASPLRLARPLSR